VLLFLLKLQKRALFVRELFHVVSHYFREKERKMCVAKKEEDLCLLGKKEKKAESKEESEKTKRMNNELLSCIGLRFFRRVV